MITEVQNADEIFNAIADELEPFAKSNGGVFSRAEDPFQLIELLGQGPGMFRVILNDDGDEQAGDSPRSGIVRIRYKITVSHNRGLPVTLGQAVARPVGNTPSLLARVTLIRDFVRQLTFPDGATSGRLDYGGREVVRVEDLPMDAYALNFSILAALPRFTITN